MNAEGALKGKVALVTGGNGAIGKAAALKMAQLGADICIVDREETGVENCAADMRALGVRAEIFVTDIRGAANCRAAVAFTLDRFGRLDALCNIANAFFPANAATMPESDWHEQLAVNLSAPVFLFQAAVPHLLQADGAVVNFSSCVAYMAQPYTAAYAATKAGLNQMTKALAKEYMDQPIRISCLAPGSMAMDTGSKAHIPADIDMAKIHRLPPNRGLISVERVAEVIAFLASDAGRGFHGACLSYDNGFSLG